MDKFRAMQTFAAIADEGSLTGAAKVLASSLPAVVRSLAAYEAQLGVRLFNRTTRRISLTEEGRQHLDSCRQVLAAVAQSENALSAGSAEPTGHITITAPVLFGQMYVAPSVTRFVTQYTAMRCSLVLLDRVVTCWRKASTWASASAGWTTPRWWPSRWARSAAWWSPIRTTCAGTACRSIRAT